MKVIAVVAQKGGSGKTTLAINLAVQAHLSGKTAAIVDLDAQATATHWADRRASHSDSPVVVPAQPVRLAKVLESARASNADLVFIDTPARASEVALSAVRVSDLVLIPCRPAVFDLETLEVSQGLIRTASASTPFYALLNGVPSQGTKRKEAEDVIRDYGIELCPEAFGQRAAFVHSTAVGLGAQEYEAGGKAAEEIQRVWLWLCRILRQPRTK